MYNNLFSSGKIGTMKSKNRIVMTAMGNYLANTDGTVSEEDIAFYTARAKGGVGIIVTEATCVDDKRGRGNTHQISVADDKFIPGLKELAESVQQYDSKLIAQIYHPGRQGVSAVNQNQGMLAPSDVECEVVHQPIEVMTLQQIEETIEKFIDAAERVKKAGLDGVEVHGAHGYLINEFLSPYTNRRNDEYGGSFENRMRFLEEIVVGIRERCGEEFPLLVRLSVDEFLETVGKADTGLKLAEGIKIAQRLEELGVDAIDVSSGIYETMNTAWEPTSFEEGWKINLAESVKKKIDIPVIGVSVIRNPEYADQLLKEEKVDFIGSARQHLADPEWSNKAQANRENEIRKCISCLRCMETLISADQRPGGFECAINIKAAAEVEYAELSTDGKGKKVVIIGAGPSGLEAARVLAEKNYKPIIFEKEDRIGGQLQLAKRPPKKDKIAWLIDYYQEQLKTLDIDLRLNTKASLENIKEINPAAVFVAQGSKPIIPDIEGVNSRNVLSSEDILNDQVELRNKKIAVIGSGMTGIEISHLLAEKDNDLSLFEMESEIGPDLYFQNLIDHLNYIGELGVDLYPEHKLIEVRNGKAVFELMDSNQTKEYDFDYIILALGRRENDELTAKIKSEFSNVKTLGDANKVGKIRNAVESGFKAARSIKSS